MYTAFYGLTHKPFQLNPDPAFYYGSKQHRRAAAYLDYGMHQHEGFIVVTGEVGAGKTTIVRGMLDNLDQDKVFAAHLVSTQLDAEDTLQLVGAAFGLRTRGVSKADVLMSLEAFLISMTTKGKRCLLVVDEAQNLTARAVEELRMLSNFQFGNHALLQSFLIGQPEFRQMLQSPHMMQFRQRVIAACHIAPLDAEDTRSYIEHRLKCAGSTGLPHIQPAAFDAIFKASGGIPRRINAVCDRLLLSGFLNGKTDFDAQAVEEVAHEIQEETMGATFTPEPGNLSADSPTGGALPRLAPGEESAMENPAAVLASLNVQQFGERLRRLERSLLQIERINTATLNLLQQLVDNGSHLTTGNEPPQPIPLHSAKKKT
ncbi:XrtA/PEP-CTERM system-associated ATPase [Rhodocyclus tenuis]|uniref:XrtA/PEP-CTERM system-associated ATPase n=1 Tax=Rhodocyclus tenuis TaxID=1066 RepID=UPI001905F335|nr:XrtA/PEP-CTERM system-associated ATPase [Rhodocyclus tenuis]MBK1679279.1 ATPase [Rhodocyclus tenuis]